MAASRASVLQARLADREGGRVDALSPPHLAVPRLAVVLDSQAEDLAIFKLQDAGMHVVIAVLVIFAGQPAAC